MRLLYCFQDYYARITEKKRTVILLLLTYALGLIFGLIFIKKTSAYDYHVEACVRFLEEVCYSQTNIFLLFLKRYAGNLLLYLLVSVSGVHFLTVWLPPVLLAYRGYTLGGSLFVFFSVYRFSGVMIVFTLYLPIKLLCDSVLTSGTVLSLHRARDFRFCGEDFKVLLLDFLCGALVLLAIGLLEALLLFAFFRSAGNIL